MHIPLYICCLQHLLFHILEDAEHLMLQVCLQQSGDLQIPSRFFLIHSLLLEKEEGNSNLLFQTDLISLALSLAVR